MKIAVTCVDNQVFGHFGKCPSFMFYETEGGKILSQKLVDASGSGHSALAGFLKDHGAELVICGGIGGGAKTALAQAGIGLVCGASGPVDTVVASYLAGTLKNDENFHCDHHDHEGEEGHSCHCH